MNDRRDFLKKSIFLAAGLVAANSTTVFASSGGLPSGIVYTKENPGKWAKKVGSHAPEVKVEGKKVTLTTKHPMSEKHYIVRHTLVSADGTVLGSKTFYPSDKEAVSTYELPPDHGSKLYATSFCNLHDFWVTEFMAK
jgi:superoxide reductase